MRRWGITAAATLLLAAGGAAPAGAAGCGLSRLLKLVWDAKRSEGLLEYTAYKCESPSACRSGSVTSGSLATKPPLTITVRSGATTVFATSMSDCGAEKCVSVNSGGCPGGADAHKAAAGLVKVAYPAKGGASVTVHVRGPMSRPAEATGPLTVALADASGYSLDATFAKCRTRSQASGVVMVCR